MGLSLAVSGACPDEAMMRAALRLALPGLTVRRVDPLAAAAAIADLGDALRLSIGESARDLPDPGRDCEERARQAALLVAIALFPPQLSPRAPPATPPAPERAPLPRPPAPRPPSGVDLIVGVLGAWSPAGGGATAVGGGLRVSLFRSAWGGALGAGVLSPVVLRYRDVAVQLLRIPIDVSATVAWRRDRLEVFGELGPTLSPFVAEATTLAIRRKGPGIDVGVRAAVGLRLRARRSLWALACLSAETVPAPARIVAEPDGDLGPTPNFYLGALLGLGWRIE